MIALWLAAGALTVLAILPLVLVLLRGTTTEARADRSALLLAQLKTQLVEVDGEVERGLINAAEADGLRLEIKRRMLAAAGDNAAGGAPPSSTKRSLGLAIGIGAAIATGAIALYLALGSPAVPDQPLAARRAAETLARAASPTPVAPDAATQQFLKAVAALEQRLAEHPEDIRGWVLLGGAYRAEQRYGDAARAFGEAYRRSGEDPGIAGDLAEVLIAAEGGRVGEETLGLLERALAFDPRDGRARFFAALGQAQAGEVAAALQGWVDLAALVPADAPFLPVVREHIARAAAVLGVDAASVQPSEQARRLAAQAPEAEAAEQAQRVRQMVDRLAERLSREPDDRDGWLKLARAYDVLGEAAKATEARARAAAISSAPAATPR